jgi:hypothetical protein
VPLTSLARRRDGTGSAAVIVSLALLGLHMSVDRISDNGIGAARFVQVRALRLRQPPETAPPGRAGGLQRATVVEGRFCRGRDVLQYLIAAAGRMSPAPGRGVCRLRRRSVWEIGHPPDAVRRALRRRWVVPDPTGSCIKARSL